MTSTPITLKQLRSDRVLIWCWLPLGGFAMWAIVKAWMGLAGEPPQGLYMVLDIGWIAVTFSLIARRSMARCPRCNHRWLRAFPWMSLSKVECGVCGHEMPEG